jgi:hypothetical protein
MKREEVSNFVVNSITPFTLKKEVLLEYLRDLNNLPIYDIYLQFNEALLLVKCYDHLFSDEEIREMKKLSDILDLHDTESDMFWDIESVQNEEWAKLRKQAIRTLEAIRPNPVGM